MIERGVHVSCGLGRLRLPVTDIVGCELRARYEPLGRRASAAWSAFGARISSFSFYLRGLVGSILVPMSWRAVLSCFARVRD
jgi:hypothetical protein